MVVRMWIITLLRVKFKIHFKIGSNNCIVSRPSKIKSGGKIDKWFNAGL